MHIACCSHRSWPVECWQLVPKCGAVVTSIQEWLDDGTAVTGLGLLHSTRFGHRPVNRVVRFRSSITKPLPKPSHGILVTDILLVPNVIPFACILHAFGTSARTVLQGGAQNRTVQKPIPLQPCHQMVLLVPFAVTSDTFVPSFTTFTDESTSVNVLQNCSKLLFQLQLRSTSSFHSQDCSNPSFLS